MQTSVEKFITLIKTPWFIAAWIILMILSYFFVDLKLALFFYAQADSTLITISQYVTNLGLGLYYIISFAVLFITFGFIIKKQKVASLFLFLLLAVIVPGAVCDLIKIIVARSRPVMYFHEHLYGFYFFHVKANMISFPSGHATVITSLMVALSYIWPKYWPGFISLAVIVAFSRVMVTAHYLSDIMMGMYLGAIVTSMLYQKFIQYPQFIRYNAAKI